MRKVEVTVDIDTTPERLIEAFINNSMLHDWWNVERALIEKRSGGIYALTWNITDKGFGYVSTGIIKHYEPASILEIDHLVYLNPDRPLFGPMTLTIKATEKVGKTELYLCQGGYQNGEDWDWYYDAVKQAWPIVVKTLKDYLEEKK
jgi:uncharacterized protein YndB with AHSA1/START domain